MKVDDMLLYIIKGVLSEMSSTDQEMYKDYRAQYRAIIDGAPEGDATMAAKLAIVVLGLEVQGELDE